MKLVLVGLYCGPLLTLIPPLKRVSGNRASDFRVSGGPPVLSFHETLELVHLCSAIGRFSFSQKLVFMKNLAVKT